MAKIIKVQPLIRIIIRFPLTWKNNTSFILKYSPEPVNFHKQIFTLAVNPFLKNTYEKSIIDITLFLLFLNWTCF